MSDALKKSRETIDRIDHEILRLFAERMDAARVIGNYKKENNLSIENPLREREILVRLRSEAPEGLQDSSTVLFRTLFELSKAEQRKLVSPETTLDKNFLHALANTSAFFPKSARVGCCGIPGTFAQTAADKLSDE